MLYTLCARPKINKCNLTKARGHGELVSLWGCRIALNEINKFAYDTFRDTVIKIGLLSYSVKHIHGQPFGQLMNGSGAVILN